MKHRIKLLSLFACLTFVLSSCVTNKETELMQNITKNYPKAPPEEYRIIPGDKLTIFVHTLDEDARILFQQFRPYLGWRGINDDQLYVSLQETRQQERSWDVIPLPVYANGTINFPHIGRIYVAGFTILETRKLLTEKLDEIAEGTSAEVSLFNRYFSILGASGARRIDMPNNTITIFQALATTSTISPSGDRSKVSIIRQTHEGSILKTFDLRSKDIVDSEFYYIQANDVIYIPEAPRKFLGSPTSFVALFSLLSSLAGIVVFIFRII